MDDAEQTHDWNKETWIDVLGRSGGKLRMECCKDQNGTINYTRASHGHCQGGRNQSRLVLFETDTVELEGTHTPHGHVLQLNQFLTMIY